MSKAWGLLTESGFRFKRVLVGSFVCHGEELFDFCDFASRIRTHFSKSWDVLHTRVAVYTGSNFGGRLCGTVGRVLG